MSAEVLELYMERPAQFDPLAKLSAEEENHLYEQSLGQGTLLAGREKPFNWELDAITSEGALHQYRAEVQIEGLIWLAENGPEDWQERIALTDDEKDTLRSLYGDEVFDRREVQKLDHGYAYEEKGEKKRSQALEHDLKADEIYLGRLMAERGLKRLVSWLHVGTTSEDDNNLAYNFMLRDAFNKVLIPAVARVCDRLAYHAAQYAESPTPGMTHAQPASPTTTGKQFGYWLNNISTTVNKLDGMLLSGKFGGAVGNQNALVALQPDFDWVEYSKGFVEHLGFKYSPIENQRNNHQAVVDTLEVANRLAVVGKDVASNVWLQILGYRLVQNLVQGEIGSSTMANKINPWRLENGEALFEQAIALMSRAHEGLLESRHERDLSDHDWERAYGDMLGRVLAGYNYLAVQLDRLYVEEQETMETLKSSAEVLAELVQTAGRTTGDKDAYDKIMALTQGKRLSLSEMRDIVLAVLPEGPERDKVLAMTPEKYIGFAPERARDAVLGWHACRTVVERGVLDESKSVDAVLFDVDGTFIFGDKDELQARFEEAASMLKLNLTPDEIREISKISDYAVIRRNILQTHNERSSNPEQHIPEEVFNNVIKEISGRFDDRLWIAEHAMKLIIGLRRSGKRTGIVTMRGSNSLPRILKYHDLHDKFDVTVKGDDCPPERKKPHPWPVVRALELLQMQDRPHRVLFVGDNQDDDIRSASAVGVKTALINPNPLDPYGARPTYHYNSLKPLLRFAR